MQNMNITTKTNQDFVLTLQLSDSKFVPFFLNGALFYMDIKEKEGGNIKIATISNDDTIERQGSIFIVDYTLSKIKLFLQKEFISDKKYINTWRYDLVMKQYNTFFNIVSGNFTILDSVTEIKI